MAKYYRLWIADLEAKTGALSNAQFGMYMRMLNHCYTHERGLPRDTAVIHRIVRAATRDDEIDCKYILDSYFRLSDDDTFRNKKVEEALTETRHYTDTQKTKSLLGVAARQAKREPAQKPRGNGHAKPDEQLITLPDWVDLPKWNAWMQARPAKARTPAAKLAALEKLETFRSKGHDANAIIADSLANGWQGIFAPDERRPSKSSGQRTDFQNLDYRSGVSEDGKKF